MEPKATPPPPAAIAPDAGTNATSSTATLVGWEEPEHEDPINPLNWPAKRKWANVLTVSVLGFLVPFESSMLAPGVQAVMAEFGTTSPAFATLAVSIFVLGFACGPPTLAPLSELYGRVAVYHATNGLLVVFTAAAALAQGPAALLAARCLAGTAAAACLAVGPGTITDVMSRAQRGRAVALWSVGTIIGPIVGPIVGGYVTDAAGWRWMFWMMTIVIGVFSILAFFMLEETYAPVLLERKAARLRRQTGNPNYKSKVASDLTAGALFRKSIFRPMKMLLCCPIVTTTCTYIAILYGTLYLLFSTYSFVFTEVYNFSTTSAGLVFVAGGLGTLAGLLYIGYFSDSTIQRRAAMGKPVPPEARLPLVITLPGSLSFPCGLFIYGWSIEARLHWIVPQVGTAITGFGSILIFVAVQTYLIDAFETHAASVVGANTVLRGLAGALIPLGGLNLYSALGWGWGNSLLGFVALLFAPLPWVLATHGARIRAMTSNKVEL